MFIQALPIILKHWQQLKYSSIRELINTAHSYAWIYNITIKMNELDLYYINKERKNKNIP